MSTDSSFKALQSRIAARLNTLPNMIGNVMVNYAMENFSKESYDGQRWPDRKKKGNSRKLLVRTGRLHRGNRFVTTANGVKFINDAPYAGIHNFGGTINRTARSETFVRNRTARGRYAQGTARGRGQTSRAYSINMPRRQFIGRSPVLLKRMRQTSIDHFSNAIT